ncbi:MAG: pantetheine-phosphate adenylyltransferase [Firmicutes bacterium]|nr:pantetheine-phosphate adenylyltransferase [Bacillota bacterium]
MKKAVYPGSFCPPTKGHLDIILRASKLFDVLYVVVASNSQKGVQNQDAMQARVNKIKESVKGQKNVQVCSFEGLVTDCMKQLGATYLVRGLRNTLDLEYEKELEQAYKSQNNEIECIYIIADPRLGHISSSIARQLEAAGGDTSGYDM